MPLILCLFSFAPRRLLTHSLSLLRCSCSPSSWSSPWLSSSSFFVVVTLILVVALVVTLVLAVDTLTLAALAVVLALVLVLALTFALVLVPRPRLRRGPGRGPCHRPLPSPTRSSSRSCCHNHPLARPRHCRCPRRHPSSSPLACFFAIVAQGHCAHVAAVAVAWVHKSASSCRRRVVTRTC